MLFLNLFEFDERSAISRPVRRLVILFYRILKLMTEYINWYLSYIVYEAIFLSISFFFSCRDMSKSFHSGCKVSFTVHTERNSNDSDGNNARIYIQDRAYFIGFFNASAFQWNSKKTGFILNLN